MFDVRKSKQVVSAPIRPASKVELENFEKHKVISMQQKIPINEAALADEQKVELSDEQKIESICINGNRLRVEPYSNEVRIDLGHLAFKNKISPTELSTDEYFFINCEIDEKVLK